MPRGKKTDKAKDADKTATAQETPKQTEGTAPAQETPEQAEGTTPTPETPKQTEGTTPAQETPEQAEGTTPTTETPEQGQEAQQDTPEPEGDGNTDRDGDAELRGEDAQERDIFAGIPNPCVYCGPTVRGVARQYTTYQGGIPDAMRKFIGEHPEARQLIVSTAQFPAYRRRLDTPGTTEAKLYKRVKEQL